MGTTINKPVHHTVILGSGRFSNDLLITATGAIDPSAAGAKALVAPVSLASALITNDGTVSGGAGSQSVTRGGNGIDFASAAGTIANVGLIEGGHGYTTASGLQGGAGGTALLVTGAADVNNAGTVAGGAGGAAPPYLADGGDGGAGVKLGGGAIANSGLIAGGSGGNGTYGSGGGGGFGISVGGGASLQNMGTVHGGAGGVGYFYGGYGAAGVILAKNAAASSNAGIIAGGDGGRVLSDYTGGQAGVGVSLGGGDEFANTGTILGGHGGYGYTAGHGGDGVDIIGGTLVNTGVIKGGAAGGYFTTGGDGVYLDDGVLDDSGTVFAGAGAPGSYPGDAVYFAAGGDVILESGATVHGRFGGWAAGDTIDVRAAQATSFTFQHDKLSLLNSGGEVVYTLDFTGGYSVEDFALQADGEGGTDVIYGQAGPSADGWHGAAFQGEAEVGPAKILAQGGAALAVHDPGISVETFNDVQFYFGRL